MQRPLGSMFAVLWYEMSYENVLRRFGDFCIVVEAVLCTAQRLNINPCFFGFFCPSRTFTCWGYVQFLISVVSILSVNKHYENQINQISIHVLPVQGLFAEC